MTCGTVPLPLFESDMNVWILSLRNLLWRESSEDSQAYVLRGSRTVVNLRPVACLIIILPGRMLKQWTGHNMKPHLIAGNPVSTK